jgi:quinoprotein glucose dehydrogenase
MDTTVSMRDVPSKPHVSRLATGIGAGLLLLLGLSLMLGGARLALLAGSPYYVVSGALLMGSAVMLWRGSEWGDYLYCATIVMTAVWALWETHAEPWGLMARLLAVSLLGIAVFFPRGRLTPGPAAASSLAALALIVGAFLFAPRQTLTQLPPSTSGMAAVNEDWQHYGNTLRGTRFSALSQVTPENVSNLEVAWVHRSGEAAQGSEANQATPLKVENTLYTCTPRSTVIAIDAASGKERWRFDPQNRAGPYIMRNCRGVAYHAATGTTGDCSRRIISTTLDGRLIALDADAGHLCEGFGERGAVSLFEGFGPVTLGYQYTTSPPTIVNDHVILGGLVVDNQAVDMPSGVIRSFDAITGVLQWAWDIGAPGRTGAPPRGESYTRGTPNAWSIFSADEKLGLVYVPTGNPSPDFFGGKRRSFDEKYGSSIVALEIETGRVRWFFQTVHHDLWDYDVPAQPALMDLPIEGGLRPALVQATKQGDIYVLDRRTGEPIVSVTERAVPQGAVPSDWVSKTQPFSELTLAAGTLSEQSMWGLTPIDQMLCRITFRESRYEGIYTPPSLQQTIVNPGITGVINWGGVALDEDRQIIIANNMVFPWLIRLIPREQMTPEMSASAIWSLPMSGTPYVVLTQQPFLSPLQVPCAAPPWGYLNAIDAKTGQLLWRRVLGTGRDVGPLGIPSMLPLPTGTPSLGGAVTTRGGLVFISGTLDRYLRAVDLRSGDELWKARLPAGGQATPMTYMADGRQFIVVTAGGHFILGTKQGDYTIAYALPRAVPQPQTLPSTQTQ